MRHGKRHGFAIAILAMVSGCGESDPFSGRVPIRGTLTLDQAPLKVGTVTLIPRGSGPAVSGTIVEGELSIPAHEGPTPGAYQVEVRSIQPTGRKVPDSDDYKTLVEETKDLVPARYNQRSELLAEVKPGEGNHFTWNLESSPKDAKSQGATRKR
jgi:hypothetical protein